MATSTIDANPGDMGILEDENDPDLSLETSDDPVSLGIVKLFWLRPLMTPNERVFHNIFTFYKQHFQELEAIKARVREMEEEAEKLKQMQTEVNNEMTSPVGSAAALNVSFEEKIAIDAR